MIPLDHIFDDILTAIDVAVKNKNYEEFFRIVNLIHKYDKRVSTLKKDINIYLMNQLPIAIFMQYYEIEQPKIDHVFLKQGIIDGHGKLVWILLNRHSGMMHFNVMIDLLTLASIYGNIDFLEKIIPKNQIDIDSICDLLTTIYDQMVNYSGEHDETIKISLQFYRNLGFF